MDRIRLERDGRVGILSLARGATNAIDGEMVAQLNGALDEIESSPDMATLVLASDSDKFFSIGLDLPTLFPMEAPEFADFIDAFCRLGMRLYSLPIPTVAALSGHAVAGGCILALCCDYRVSASGKKLMGLNEVKLGIAIPFFADCILRDWIGSRRARDIHARGEFLDVERSLELGWIDEVHPLESVRPSATALARSLTESPPAAYALIKANRVEPVLRAIRADYDRKTQAFLDLWFTAETRVRLERALEQFRR